MPAGEKADLSESYRIFETRQFSSDLKLLGHSVALRLEEKLREHVYPQLRENPFFGPGIKRLREWQPVTWRYRVGDWRFFYEVDETRAIVFMTAADHRKQAYR